MKKIFATSLLLLLSIAAYEQVLLEDKDGDQLANNAPLFANATKGISTSLIKLNTGDESLGFNYITTTKNFDPAHYQIHEFGIKAKSTEGFAAVFSNGQFSPGIRFFYSLTKVPLAKDNADYIDWGGLNISYDVNKYMLFRSDTIFSKQLYAKTFSALNASLNYNALIKTRWIVNAKAGYSRRNNYDDLTAVEVQDITSIFDPATATDRKVIKKTTAREGNFVEYNAFPFALAITKATPTDSDPVLASKLRIGYTVYLKNVVSKFLPQTDVGAIVFLTKQDKNGVRCPVFGLNIQASDPFDVQQLNNGIKNRIAVGFTTIFSL